MEYIVGIDPGKKGAIAVIDINGKPIEIYNMPEVVNDVKDLLKKFKDKIRLVVIERQWIRPIFERKKDKFNKNEVIKIVRRISSEEKLVGQYYQLCGIVIGLELPLEVVSPQTWQKVMLGNGKKERKVLKLLSIKKAKDLFPQFTEKIEKHDKADALLLAEYARRSIIVNQAGGVKKNAEE